MIKVEAIPAFNDNYIWVAYCTETKKSFVVDPGSAAEVIEFLNSRNLDLEAIVITHHHPDHTGGVKQLKQETGAIIYGSDNSKLDIFDERLDANSTLTILNQNISVIEVPGHTLDHIAFFLPQTSELSAPALFCGDTLFSAGCGRLFEGSAEQMFNSMQKLTQLPASTLIYAAHEYTLANLDFALALMPTNQALIAYLEKCVALREQNIPTLPSSLEQELAINPFLRSKDPELKNSLSEKFDTPSDSPVEVFTATRRAKDNF